MDVEEIKRKIKEIEEEILRTQIKRKTGKGFFCEEGR